MSTIIQSETTYVEQTPEGSWRVAGSRVSLDSVIYAFHQGETPEQIVAAFPALSLEQAYGAVAFYLRHREMLDANLESQQQRWAKLREEADERNKELRERILSRSNHSNTQESAP